MRFFLIYMLGYLLLAALIDVVAYLAGFLGNPWQVSVARAVGAISVYNLVYGRPLSSLLLPGNLFLCLLVFFFDRLMHKK